MASPQHQLRSSIITTIFLLTFAILPSRPVGRIIPSYTQIIMNSNKIHDMKSVLGSKPPRCTNRCKGCTPCDAVIAVPPRTKRINSQVPITALEEEPYYLVTWKCRCKDNLFPP